MKETRFIDTSILLEIIEVPNRCDDPTKYKKEFVEFTKQKQATIIMPISVLIETGNHINHIKNASAKEKSVKRFMSLVNTFVKGELPWVFYGYDFNAENITRVAETYNDLVYNKVGIGDVFIIDSYNNYIQKLKSNKNQNHKILIWSKDAHLSGYSQVL